MFRTDATDSVPIHPPFALFASPAFVLSLERVCLAEYFGFGFGNSSEILVRTSAGLSRRLFRALFVNSLPSPLTCPAISCPPLDSTSDGPLHNYVLVRRTSVRPIFPSSVDLPPLVSTRTVRLVLAGSTPNHALPWRSPYRHGQERDQFRSRDQLVDASNRFKNLDVVGAKGNRE